MKSAMHPLKKLYGSTPVDDFGPLVLQAVRAEMIKEKWTRGFINKSVGRLRLIFKWGVANELVSPATLTALQAVSGLQAGRTDAPDNPEREPVPQAHIDAVKAKVRQRTRDLIDLQLLTGTRPGELLKLTTTDGRSQRLRMGGEPLVAQDAAQGEVADALFRAEGPVDPPPVH